MGRTLGRRRLLGLGSALGATTLIGKFASEKIKSETTDLADAPGSLPEAKRVSDDVCEQCVVEVRGRVRDENGNIPGPAIVDIAHGVLFDGALRPHQPEARFLDLPSKYFSRCHVDANGCFSAKMLGPVAYRTVHGHEQPEHFRMTLCTEFGIPFEVVLPISGLPYQMKKQKLVVADGRPVMRKPLEFVQHQANEMVFRAALDLVVDSRTGELLDATLS